MKVNSVRFGVRDGHGRRSSSWKLWHHRSDIYISARPLRGTLKLSLHESGSWQVSFTSEFVRKAPKHFETMPRHIAIWQKPREAEPGVIVACRIHIPIAELRRLGEETGRNSGRVRWVGAPADDLSIQFLIVIAERTACFQKWPGEADPATLLVGKIILPDERSVWVLYREQPVNPDIPKLIEFARGRLSHGVTLQHPEGSVDFTKDSLRFVIFSSDKLGAEVLIEGAVNEEPKEIPT
jgi:hypothetical protein